ncbi:hypothetical protein EWM64_g4110 [Hericium alpestre]|uniref:Uncharacterized protein n=1 Tax=Hericium alpestre TaxID=135208 RepID=A0A4Y9ZYJ8_9AGAM|nr:hypothetical protein EWM64_g4110 [Hericium alpestre]
MTFVCQQCKQPLQLDASLEDLAPSAYDMIVGSLPPQLNTRPPPASEAEQLGQVPAPSSAKAAWRSSAHANPVRPSVLSARAQGKQPMRSTLPNESFVLLQDSVINHSPSQPSPSSSARRAANTRSAPNGHQSPVHEPQDDHQNPSPLSHHLRSTLRLLNLLTSRTDIDHPLCSECTHVLLSNLTRQLEETKKERDGYIAFEKEVRREKEREKDGMSKQEAESKITQLKEDERLAIEQLKETEQEHEQLTEELRALELEEKALEEEEDELSYSVEWAEINAAWGQTLLLLYTIARKLDFTFENYRLVPMGSFSRIDRTAGDKASYELYGSGDLHLGRLLHNRRFDFAMVAFLDCLKQLTDWAKSQDPTLEFPHQIVKDKIGESSVKLQFSQEEAWTRALRHVLLALKILLKWTTNGSNG